VELLAEKMAHRAAARNPFLAAEFRAGAA